MKIIDVTQGSVEWHALRRTHIGASECAAIMGDDPYTTPYQVWRKKVFGDQTEDNYAMERGRELEPVARAAFEEKMGCMFSPLTAISEEYPWMLASFDGVSDDGTACVEIKCPLPKNFYKLMVGDEINIPMNWQWQIQHQLCVSGFEMAFLLIYGGSGSIEIRVPRDEVMIAQLIEKERHFWHNYVLKFEKPPYEALDVELRSDPEWLEKSIKWQKAHKARLDAEAEEESARNELIEATDDQNCEGGGIKVTKYVRQGNVDYKAVPELEGVDLELYRKPSTVAWRIT